MAAEQEHGSLTRRVGSVSHKQWAFQILNLLPMYPWSEMTEECVLPQKGEVIACWSAQLVNSTSVTRVM